MVVLETLQGRSATRPPDAIHCSVIGTGRAQMLLNSLNGGRKDLLNIGQWGRCLANGRQAQHYGQKRTRGAYRYGFHATHHELCAMKRCLIRPVPSETSW